MRFGLLILAGAMLLPTPLFAHDKDAAKHDSADKKVCKSVVKTGSIMPTRICHTKAEWAAITGKSVSDLDRTRDMETSRSMVGTSHGN